MRIFGHFSDADGARPYGGSGASAVNNLTHANIATTRIYGRRKNKSEASPTFNISC